MTCKRATTGNDIMRIFIALITLVFSFTLATATGFARSPSLIGSWQGYGTVQAKTGAKERTKCRAKIEKAPARGKYQAEYRCSSPVGLVSQDVVVHRTRRNHYSGTFHNAQYNIHGEISIILDGDKQTVTMQSSEGLGELSLNRK